MDANGYPEDAELEQIRKWDPMDFKGCMEFMRERWMHPSYFMGEQPDGTWKIATAGWSGNESMIYALEENPCFFALHWESSHRGGLYVFDPLGKDGKRGSDKK